MAGSTCQQTGGKLPLQVRLRRAQGGGWEGMKWGGGTGKVIEGKWVD